MRKTLRFILALSTLLFGLVTLIFRRNNLKPVYRGLRYFLEHKSYQQTLNILKNDPATAALMAERYHEFYQVPWNELKLMPAGSLGYEFYCFMNHPEVTPLDKLPESKVEITPEIDYLRRRIRLIHDIHHVLTGHPSDELGEMGISAFYVAQIRSPLNAVLLAVGLIKCTIKCPERMHELMDIIVEGYAMGQRAQNLFGQKYEEVWTQPVVELRKQYGIIASKSDFIQPQVAAPLAGLTLVQPLNETSAHPAVSLQQSL
jgi:ubiquinone biosynthesis protein COQ4